jgi:DNA primase
MSAVDEIKARLDIVQYISRTVSLKRAGRTFKACCPFHGEKTPSFVVDPGRQSWRCFGACGTGGDVIAFAMRQNGWTFTEAIAELGKLTGVEVRPRSPEQTARDEQADRLRGLMKSAAEFYHERLLDPNDPSAIQTVEYTRGKRGLTDDTIARFGIGYAPQGWRNTLDLFTPLGYSEDDLIACGLAIKNENGRVYDRFRNRLMIPIRDERGRVVGFGARALAAEDNPKYLNSPQTALFDKSRLLFALDLAGNAIRESETVVVVEGYLDAIQAHQAGYANVVAQMGTALTETQLKLVAPRWAKKIIMALDSDAAGQNATRRSLEVAREALQADYGGKLSVDIRILSVPGAKDPDDLIREHPEQWASLVADAAPVAEYVIGMETAQLPPKASLQEREAVARALLPILTASESDLYKQDNLQKLAIKLRIAERDLLAWASEQTALTRLKAQRAPLAPEVPDDVFGAPPDEIDAEPGDVRVSAPALPARVGQPTENALEHDCLRMLLLQPELLYAINRKLRELANGDQALLNEPLNDLCLDDFSHPDYRALASLFSESFDQDDLDPLTYVRQHLDGQLEAAFEHLLREDLDHLRPKLRHGLGVDLQSVIYAVGLTSAPPDPIADAVNKALKLRLQRLQRERQELVFLQMDDEEKEEALAQKVQIAIMHSSKAKQRIESALRELSRSPHLQ